MKKTLIVGAGISGATIANKLANAGKQVVVIDEKSHVAGNIYDKKEEGIMVHQFGAHIFHTSFPEVYDFLSQFTTFTDYQHQVKAVIKGKEVPIPFNFNSIDILFDAERAARLKDKLIEHYDMDSKVPILELRNAEDEDLKYLAEYVYEYIFLHYTIKQWGLKPDEIDKSVSGRVPIYVGTDDRYFPWDKYQGIPNEGYTQMIKNMFNHDNIDLQLETSFSSKNMDDYEHVYYTGTIDGFFDHKYGELPYRSERFENETLNQEYFLSNSVINYPNEHDYTRIIEHKYFLDDKTDKTIISYEYPEAYKKGKNDPYYPIQSDETTALYEKYIVEAKALGNVTFLGRLGDYKYYDMDKAVNRALEVFKEY